MKFSEQWLREWVNPPITTQQLAAQLTMAGLEVDSTTPVAGDFTQVIIGNVLSAEQHPNAERLRVCLVDIGQKEPLTIVCGGANVRAGLKVPVVIVGGSIKGQKIQAAKLRGVASQGMICSVSELGLQETSTGIMELPADAPVGEDFAKWLKLDDHSFDLHVTPNRGDCLSIQGVAREVAVLNDLQFSPPAIQKVAAEIEDKLPITVSAPDDCPRYLGRIIQGIDPAATTPVWLTERLRRSGLRPVHPVVDITNYVLLELGQPLHAFDLHALQGGIEVRRARQGEKITLLDEQEVALDSEVLIIADAKQPQAIAGIMGGSESAVKSGTTAIFLESAFFSPLSIAGRARRIGLNTDAGYRFERGVDPELARQALERATQLLLEIAGGKAGVITEVCDSKKLPEAKIIKLRSARIARVLGIAIPDETVVTILQRLGMQVKKDQDKSWDVIPPAHRFDLEIEADLIEELARIHGYGLLPQCKPHTTLHFMPLSEKQIHLERLQNVLIDRGYHEVITYSFVAPKIQQLIDPQQKPMDLLNPISADLAVMRTSLWPGLLNTVAYNQNRQQNRVRIFETGLRFVRENNLLKQEPMLAGVACGDAYPEQWGISQRALDFYDIKADLEALFALTGDAKKFVFEKAEHNALHPGQSCSIKLDGKNIGYLGALHPALLQQRELTGTVYCFELELNALGAAKLPVAKVLSKFPAIRRDISFWVSTAVTAEALVNAIRTVVGEWLIDLFIFDVYQDKNEQDKISLALSLILQHPDKTLVDDEVNAVMEKVIAHLKGKFSISLRE